MMATTSPNQFPATPMNSVLMNLKSKARDDLTVIKGIGPARQQWLRESLHVSTFRDLAALSSHEIALQLKAVGQIASRKKIDHWIVEAQRLAAAELSPKQNSEAARPATIAQPPNASGGDGWKPIASFVVEFQAHIVTDQPEQRTKVHHIETDSCAMWPDIETDRLAQWMLDHVAERVVQAPSAKT